MSLAALRKPMSDVYNKTRRTTYTNVSYETEQTRDARDATRRPAQRTARRARAHAAANTQHARLDENSSMSGRASAPARPRGQPKPSRAGQERYAGVGGAALLAGGGLASDRTSTATGTYDM